MLISLDRKDATLRLCLLILFVDQEINYGLKSVSARTTARYANGNGAVPRLNKREARHEAGFLIRGRDGYELTTERQYDLDRV